MPSQVKYTYCRSILSTLVDISLDVDQELDITCLRGTGLQPGEEELPETNAQSGKIIHLVGLSCPHL